VNDDKHLLLLVWHAPLGVLSAKRRHQSPEWTILSHSYRLLLGEIVRTQVLLDSLHPCTGVVARLSVSPRHSARGGTI